MVSVLCRVFFLLLIPTIIEHSRSHATHPLLPTPTPASFTLDFRQLLQAAAAADPTTTTTAAGGGGGSGQPGTARSKRQRKTKQRQQIVEEEDWEVVDEAG